MAHDKTIYQQVVDVFYEYLGPSAERFAAREVEAHLHKKPEELTLEDIDKLHEWCRLAIALLTEDQKMVDDFSDNLLSIGQRDRAR